MREVLFKNITLGSSRKKDVLVKEVFERKGVVAKTERRCFYFIKDVVTLENSNSLQSWLDSQNNKTPVMNRHFHILKEHKDQLGEDKLICKIAGTLYAVVENKVYTIAFLHSFKVSFIKNMLPH